jgi:GH25 family lysozyme M1 (1,4-beta-N-acetylmuramidase)
MVSATIRALVAAVAVTAGALLAAAPTHAATTPAYHPDRDFAGSTVAAHEGRGPAGFAPLTTIPGLDVSSWQGAVNWSSVKSKGATFAYVKATESTDYQSPDFTQQYDGSYNVGLIRGAYHFALPNKASGTAQADYFVAHGGGWSKDGKTLPPMLDIEYNPYGDTCYGLSQASMRSWIQAFVNEMHARTTRWVTVYTTLDWWTKCTGNWSGLAANDPLFIARYASSAGTLPAGWSFWTFWQYADSGTFPGDQDLFSAGLDRLKVLATG